MTRVIPETRGPSEPGARRFPPAIRSDPDRGLLRTLLHGLYDLGWILFVLLASPWLAWKSLRVRGFGRMVRERLGCGIGAIPRATRPRILVHGVSVGEASSTLLRKVEELTLYVLELDHEVRRLREENRELREGKAVQR